MEVLSVLYYISGVHTGLVGDNKGSSIKASVCGASSWVGDNGSFGLVSKLSLLN